MQNTAYKQKYGPCVSLNHISKHTYAAKTRSESRGTLKCKAESRSSTHSNSLGRKWDETGATETSLTLEK